MWRRCVMENRKVVSKKTQDKLGVVLRDFSNGNYSDMKNGGNPQYSFGDFISFVFYGTYPESAFENLNLGDDAKKIKSASAIRLRGKDILNKRAKLSQEPFNSIISKLSSDVETVSEDVVKFPNELNFEDSKYSLNFSLQSIKNDEEFDTVLKKGSVFDDELASVAVSEVLSGFANQTKLRDAQLKKFSNDHLFDNQLREFYREVVRKYNKKARSENKSTIPTQGPKGLAVLNDFIDTYHNQMIDGIEKLQKDLGAMSTKLTDTINQAKKIDRLNKKMDKEEKASTSKAVVPVVSEKDFYYVDGDTYYTKKITESIADKKDMSVIYLPDSDENTYITFTILKENNTSTNNGFVFGNTITASVAEMKNKYNKQISEASGCHIIGIERRYDDKVLLPRPLTKEIVDSFSSAKTLVVNDTIKDVNNDAFDNNNLENVIFMVDNTKNNNENNQSNGNYNIKIIPNTVEERRKFINTNDKFQIGVAKLNNNEIELNNYSVGQFNTLYKNKQLENCAKGIIYTFSKESNVPKNVEVKNQNASSDINTKDINLPESLFGKKRSFFSRLGRWVAKHPVATALLATSLALPIILASGLTKAVVLYAGITSVTMLVVQGIARRVSKKYDNFFLEDKANKIARKFRRNINLLQYNANRQVELVNAYNSQTNKNVELNKVAIASLENDKIQKRLDKLANKYETIANKIERNNIDRDGVETDNKLYSLMAEVNKNVVANVKQVDEIFSKQKDSGDDNVVAKVLHSRKKRIEKLENYINNNNLSENVETEKNSDIKSVFEDFKNNMTKIKIERKAEAGNSELAEVNTNSNSAPRENERETNNSTPEANTESNSNTNENGRDAGR